MRYYLRISEAMRSDTELDELLAGRRLAGPTKDRIFEGALAAAGVGRQRRRPWRLHLSLATGLSLAAGAAGLMLVSRTSHREDPIRAKGGETAIELEVACVGVPGASLAACPLGATLVFSVAGATEGGYLAGYAEHRSSRERVWYFSADGVSPAVAGAPGATGTNTVIKKAVRVGPEHALGEYRVELFVTAAPLDKRALRDSAPSQTIRARRELTVRVVQAPAAR